MPSIDRLVCKAHVVHLHRTPLGERLPVLINAATGVPPILALRFALYQREQGSSARLTRLLRRVGDLYDWVKFVEGADLDLQIRSGNGIRLDQITRALQDLELPSQHGEQITVRPRLRNQRCEAWGFFLRFVYRPALWRTGLGVLESHSIRRELEHELGILLAELNSRRQSVPEPQARLGLTPDELTAIDEVLDQRHPMCPFPKHTLKRNVALYDIARWGGARLGELLKIKDVDLPSAERRGDKIVRQLQGHARTLRIIRRPDDADDPREFEPSVKRRDRNIDLPDDVFDHLFSYYHSTRRLRHSAYFFLTEDCAKPLSQSRADKIIRQLGEAAARNFEATHGINCSHSLRELTWHRLRHTRAIELVPVFFPDYTFDPRSERSIKQLNSFLDYFGWASPDSATPYISPLYKIDAQQRMAKHYEELRRKT